MTWKYRGPEAVPQKRAYNATVGDDDNRAVRDGVVGADLGDRSLEPLENLFVGLGVGEGPALLLGKGEELFGKLGVAGLLFGPGITFKDAAVTLCESRHGDDLPGEAGLSRHYLGGLEGPGEGTCVDAGDSCTLQGTARAGGLAPAFFGEGEV